jgi:hypothetical protein
MAGLIGETSEVKQHSAFMTQGISEGVPIRKQSSTRAVIESVIFMAEHLARTRPPLPIVASSLWHRSPLCRNVDAENVGHLLKRSSLRVQSRGKSVA